MEFSHPADMEFKDLSSEACRSYEFPNGSVVTITKPLKINVSASGGHRIFDAAGVCHYIPAGWVHLKWTVNPGRPHFDF